VEDDSYSLVTLAGCVGPPHRRISAPNYRFFLRP